MPFLISSSLTRLRTPGRRELGPFQSSPQLEDAQSMFFVLLLDFFGRDVGHAGS